MQLEFKYLAHLTGRKEFWEKAEHVSEPLTFVVALLRQQDE